MTKDQAIKLLRKDTSISEIHKLRDKGLSHTEVTDKIQEAMDMGIEAIEKQIPKKVISASNDEDDFDYGMCPTCNQKMVWGDYCTFCGQRIDWSEVE